MLKEILRTDDDDDGINRCVITEYIRSATPDNVGFLAQLEAYAKENHVPIVQKEVSQFLRVMCEIVKPKNILEVGTAIGYSASVMFFASGSDCVVTTIERNEKMIELANENLAKGNLLKNINIIEGDATIVLKQLQCEYDLLFLDAAKGQYPEFLKECIRLLKKDGVLICDNVLFKGMTADDLLVKRRKRTIVKRLRTFVEEIMHSSELTSSLMPLGDGVTISKKI